MWLESKEFDQVLYNLCLEEDREEYWSKIKYSSTAVQYCINIKDRPEIRRLITDSKDAFAYCKYVKNDPLIRRLIIDPESAFEYCVYIDDDPKIRKYIIKSLHLQNVYLNIFLENQKKRKVLNHEKDSLVDH